MECRLRPGANQLCRPSIERGQETPVQRTHFSQIFLDIVSGGEGHNRHVPHGECLRAVLQNGTNQSIAALVNCLNALFRLEAGAQDMTEDALFDE